MKEKKTLTLQDDKDIEKQIFIKDNSGHLLEKYLRLKNFVKQEYGGSIQIVASNLLENAIDNFLENPDFSICFQRKNQ